MRRVVVIAVAGLALAGCSSDAFKSAPPMVSVRMESVPAGVDAKTSIGPGCKTPCAVSVPAENFSVTFTSAKFQPQTIDVVAAVVPGEFGSPPSATLEPNPVYAELQPLKKGAKPKAKKPKPAATAPAEQ